MAKNENDAQCEYEEAELREEALKAVNDIELPKGESIDDDEAEKLASAIIKRAASLKAVKIDRDRFLRVELAKYCPEVDSEVAIAQSPIVAGVSPQVLDRIAADAIDLEVKKCAGLSFLAGIPGGVVSGGLTYASFKPGAERLRKYLRSLPLSGIDPSEPDGASINIVEGAINAAAPVVEGASAAIASAGKHAGSALSDGAKVAGGVVQDGARAASEGIGSAVRGVGSLLGSKRKK